MGITSVEAGLTAFIPVLKLVDGHASAAEPKLSLGNTTCEDYVRELLDLLSDSCVCRLTQARRSIIRATGYCNENVFPGPLAALEHLAQLRKIHAELGGTVR